ncbi:MAG: 4Fe-4S binding protein [Prolixibacteraceae bacterium]|jgi:ferredoxin|nr:4Fe-4S binding protein [Prolixibacteraceae bacterium]
MNLKQRMIAKKVEKELSIKEGVFIVNEASCDGCGKCIEICPKNAINIKELNEIAVKRLSFKGRLKVRIKGNKKASINQNICVGCGRCLKQCHEFAIHKVAI